MKGDIAALLMAELADALIVTTQAGDVMYWNAGAQSMFGYTEADAVGRNLAALVVPANLHGEYQQHLTEVMNAGHYTFEALRRRKNGSLIYVDSSAKLIHAPEGTGRLVLFAKKDVTPLRIKRDEKLVAAKYRDLLESTPDAILMLNPTGHIVFLNSQAEKLFRYEKGELNGKPVEILLPPSFRERHIEHRSNYFLHPRTRSMGAGLELSGVRKDGTEFAVEISLSPLQMEDVSLVMSAIRDISARIAAERKFRGLLEAAPDAIVIVDSTGSIVLINSQTENLFGYRRSELLGQRIEILMPERYRAAHPGHRSGFFTAPKVRPMGTGFQLFGMRKDGTEFPVEISLSPLETEGGRLVSSAIRDLTERRHFERTLQIAQAQRMETVGQLTGGVAHDFNNLLTVIQANGEDIQEALIGDPALWHQAEMILQAAKRGTGLVRQLLAYARKQELHPTIADLNALTQASFNMLTRTMPENIAIRLVTSAVPKINVDTGSLENAILNMALNARDAMPGGGTLVIETSTAVLDADYAAANPDTRPGTYAQITITDNGPGMTQDVIERAFEPFFTTKEIGKGTGLGLSMVYGFVRQSGGHIKIDSAPGRGTSIRIYLPEMHTDADETVINGTSVKPASLSGITILLVEDDELVSKSVAAKLARLGYHVVTAANAAGAFNVLEKHDRIDLVLTDIIMPGDMTGADLARKVQERWPDIKVLATSGYTETTLLGKIEIPDGAYLLAKPYTNAELGRAILNTLKGAVTPADTSY